MRFLGAVLREPAQRGGVANAFGGGQASMVFANQARGELRMGAEMAREGSAHLVGLATK